MNGRKGEMRKAEARRESREKREIIVLMVMRIVTHTKVKKNENEKEG